MRINGTSRSAAFNSRVGSRGAKKGGEVFRAPQPGGSAKAPPPGPVQSAAGIDAILALQGVEDPLIAKKRAVKHGQSMLDTLEEMKSDLLSGKISEGRLNRLMALVTRARQRADPDLEALIDDIELRAMVELAKLGRFVN
mgnify:CR=1 FL=1